MTAGSGERMTFHIPLDGRGGTLTAELRLPRSLTPDQAARIKAFVDILVIDDGADAADTGRAEA